jgi:alanine dehydrogenase
MIIGIPKEIKDNEFRVAMTPAGAGELTKLGHSVLVQKDAGLGSAITDAEFKEAGALVVDSPAEIFSRAEIIIKVKEPLMEEFKFFRDGLIIFTFLHLAAKKELTKALLEINVTAIGYETIEKEDGSLPILAPMSAIAGKLSVQFGANSLLAPCGGPGILLGGVANIERGCVVILGAGIVGQNAAEVAIGLGARTIILDINTNKFRMLHEKFHNCIETVVSTPESIEKLVPKANLLIGAIHVAGAKTPVIVKRELVAKMKKGSVIVDVDVDQGGCIETIRPTTHSEPTFVEEGVIHYGVSNMPGAVPRTSTFALANVTLPYIKTIAELGVEAALKDDLALKRGLNTYKGKIMNRAVSETLGIKYEELTK